MVWMIYSGGGGAGISMFIDVLVVALAGKLVEVWTHGRGILCVQRSTNYKGDIATNLASKHRANRGGPRTATINAFFSKTVLDRSCVYIRCLA